MTRPPQFAVRIAGTGSAAPGPVVTTAEVARRVVPPRDGADVVARTGIASRRLAPPGASAAALGAAALRSALAAAGIEARDLARLVFVTSGAGDLSYPANANLTAAALGLAGSCDCFDVNNACMGFLTALDLAARSIVTGSGPVGITVVELASRTITPDDPRPYLVFGDGVAAAVIAPGPPTGGILASYLWNDGIAFGNVRLENALATGRLETARFTASHARMGEEAVEAVVRSAGVVLERAGLAMGDVQWVLPHQPNGPLLDAMTAALGVDAARVVRIVDETGSVGAAAIPLSLDRLVRTRPVRPGDLLLLLGVGGGLAAGAMLYRVPA